MRALGWGDVFREDGVLLALWDSSYRARRALWILENFPHVLWFDPYLAFPSGAVVPAPPLYDLFLATAARLAGGGQAALERVAAWASPAWAALTLWPVYACGRTLAGRGTGLAAAALFALIPVSVLTSMVGDADHHAAVACLGALHAAAIAAVSDPRRTRASHRRLAAALACTRMALALTWSGSLLLLAVGEAALLLAASASGRRSLYAAQAAGAGAAALCLAPWVAIAPTPAAGAFTAVTLSWLHPTLLAGAAAVGGALALLEARRPTRGALARLARAAAAAGLLGLAMLAIPALRAALARGLGFVAGADVWAPRNVEQAPLFAWLARDGRPPGRSPLHFYGAFAWAIPLAAFAPLLRARRAPLRAPAAALALWNAGLGGLAMSQVRFGSDFAPMGCVGFALLLSELRALAAGRVPRSAATAGAVALGALLLWPGIRAAHLPRLARARAQLAGRPVSESGPTTLLRFARAVRAATPETSGFLAPDGRPEYGVLCKPSHGYAVLYGARRPVSATGAGPYVDAEKLAFVERFFTARTEAQALAIAARLAARYAITWDHVGLVPGSLAHLLHREDGSSGLGFRRAERLRLVTESPPGGRPLPTAFPRGAPAGVVAYKLFEIVEGARLDVHTAPGRDVRASLELGTAHGRVFTYRAAARADGRGVARLRVPYASDAASTPTRALGPWRVRAGDAEREVRVSDDDVRAGRAIPVDLRAAPPEVGGRYST